MKYTGQCQNDLSVQGFLNPTAASSCSPPGTSAIVRRNVLFAVLNLRYFSLLGSAATFGFGRVVASEKKAPNMLANMV